MPEPLIQIRNHHSSACGDPPKVDDSQGHLYIGYFENASGEQWIFIYDRNTAKAILRGGDTSWDREIAVIDGRVSEFLLDKAEQLWLQACWLSVHN